MRMFRLVAALVGALVVVGTAGLVAACGGGTGDAVPDSAGREVVLVTYESFALPERAAAELSAVQITSVRLSSPSRCTAARTSPADQSSSSTASP